MNRNPLPPPPQMGNGGSPPAHLPSSSLSNPEAIIDRAFDDFRQSFNDLLQLFAAEALAAQESAKAADDRRRQEMTAAAEALAAQESAKAADGRRRQEMTASAEALAVQEPAFAKSATLSEPATAGHCAFLANDRPLQTVCRRA
jgi:hypothetical protein